MDIEHDTDSELQGSYHPTPCFNCGSLEDPRVYWCGQCDTLVCQRCNKNILLRLDHLPTDHLESPDPSPEELGYCGDCGNKLPECRCEEVGDPDPTEHLGYPLP